MRRVTLNFSESDYKLFYHYCGNYYRLHGETRKNSIQVLLELQKHQIIDLQEHSLDNIFTFFYHKNQVFETDCQGSGHRPHIQMRVRMCSDIIAFLEDLEKIYLLLRKKGVDANYLLILGIFSKIIDEKNRMQLDDLNESAMGAIDTIVSILTAGIEKKLGPDPTLSSLIHELVVFAGMFNRLSPEVPFSDDIIPLIAYSLVKKTEKETSYEEILELIRERRDDFEMEELENTLEGGVHARNTWGLEFSWEQLTEPLKTLNALFAQRQVSMAPSLDLLTALEEPLRLPAAMADYPGLAVYQEPYRAMRRRNQPNTFLIRIDDRQHSTVQLYHDPGVIVPARSWHAMAKKYYPLTSGFMILAIIALAFVAFSHSPTSMTSGDNIQGTMMNAKSIMKPLNTSPQPTTQQTTNSSAKPLVKSGTSAPTTQPTPVPTQRYVTIEPIVRVTESVPKSHQDLISTLAMASGMVHTSENYISIFRNNISYNLENAYKISFDLKKAPMIIRYTVFPQNITDKKWFEPRDSGGQMDTAIINRSDESAWFEIKIYNDQGLFSQDGWGRVYAVPLTQQEIVVRIEDDYRIEFSGQKVAVEVEVMVPKGGNIVGT
jgi:hypothetical protein